jgi:hypothetical protein
MIVSVLRESNFDELAMIEETAFRLLQLYSK